MGEVPHVVHRVGSSSGRLFDKLCEGADLRVRPHAVCLDRLPLRTIIGPGEVSPLHRVED